MPRIQLAHWHGGRAPGDVVDVDADELSQLHRDGRVACVLPDEPEPPTAPPDAPSGEPQPEPEPDEGDGPVEETAKSGRRRR